MNAREAAAMLGLHVRTIRRAIDRGDLPAQKRHNVYRVPIAAVLAYGVKSQRPTVADQPIDGISLTVPTPSTSFVGRVAECDDLRTMILEPNVRMVTLTGPGGVGKTRVAIELAQNRSIQSAFPGGVVFVELEGVDTAERVPPAISAALGMVSSPERLVAQNLARRLNDRSALLILDNLEHVPDCTSFIADLLRAASGLVIVATSRVPIGISAEREYPIRPLLINTGTIDQIPDAVQLFVDRAQSVDPAFRLNDENAEIISRICARVDGLPLAIELTAVLVRFLSPAALLPRLDHRLELLTGGPKDAPQRNQTMQQNIAWSYDLLSETDQAVFRRLAVFVDGFTLDAAESLLSATGGKSTVLNACKRLFDQNLLQRFDRLPDLPRYRMLETIREFALERLAAEDDMAMWKGNHAIHFLNTAEAIADPNTVLAECSNMSLLGIDIANLRAALIWFESSNDVERLIQLAGALRFFWIERDFQDEGISWLERAVASNQNDVSLQWARAQVGLGWLLMYRAEWDRSRDHFDQGIEYLCAQSMREEWAMALIGLGSNAAFQQEFATAKTCLLEAREIASAVGNQQFGTLIGPTINANLSVIARELGDLAEATRLAQTALAQATRNGQQRSMFRIQSDLGDIFRARELWTDTVRAYQATLAHGASRISLRNVAEALAGIACCLVAWDRLLDAAMLFGAEQALRTRIGLATRFPADQTTVDAALASVRRGLDVAAFHIAFKDGQERALDEVLVWVRELDNPDAVPTSTVTAWQVLTPRQLEITRLVAAFRTDIEIANVLSISPRTVGWHISNILATLEMGSRRNLAALATQDGINRLQ